MQHIMRQNSDEKTMLWQSDAACSINQS